MIPFSPANLMSDVWKTQSLNQDSESPRFRFVFAETTPKSWHVSFLQPASGWLPNKDLIETKSKFKE